MNNDVISDTNDGHRQDGELDTRCFTCWSSQALADLARASYRLEGVLTQLSGIRDNSLIRREQFFSDRREGTRPLKGTTFIKAACIARGTTPAPAQIRANPCRSFTCLCHLGQ